jgi:hypothetical protein
MQGKEMKGAGWDTQGLFLETSWGEDTETSASSLTPDPLHHNAAGFLFLSLPDAPQNLDIRVFWENSTGVRSLGSMEVRWGDAVKTEQNQAPHHSSPLGSYVSPPQSPTLSPGRPLSEATVDS